MQTTHSSLPETKRKVVAGGSLPDQRKETRQVATLVCQHHLQAKKQAKQREGRTPPLLDSGLRRLGSFT